MGMTNLWAPLMSTKGVDMFSGAQTCITHCTYSFCPEQKTVSSKWIKEQNQVVRTTQEDMSDFLCSWGRNYWKHAGVWLMHTLQFALCFQSWLSVLHFRPVPSVVYLTVPPIISWLSHKLLFSPKSEHRTFFSSVFYITGKSKRRRGKWERLEWRLKVADL